MLRFHPALLAAALAAAPLTASAAVVGYWRFEDSPGFLEDSGGAGRTLTTPSAGATPTQTTLPVSGPGSAFASAVAGTAKTASFDGGDRFQRADEAAFTDTTFTIEALINGSDFTSNGSQKSIVGQWNSTGNQRSWLFAVNGSGASASLNLLYSTLGSDTLTVPSGLPALEQGKDYYVAVTVDLTDTSAAGISFYQKNLTDNLPAVASGVTHTQTTLFNSNNALTIGATNSPSSPFTGLIDEVRYSDTKLSAEDLMVVVPEPGAIGLLALAATAALLRRRRR